jgi:hypothetical protein
MDIVNKEDEKRQRTILKKWLISLVRDVVGDLLGGVKVRPDKKPSFWLQFPHVGFIVMVAFGDVKGHSLLPRR